MSCDGLATTTTEIALELDAEHGGTECLGPWPMSVADC